MEVVVDIELSFT